jgi:hypothetical protein
VMAGNADHGHDAAVQEQGHQHAAVRGELWEGSRQGIAYSEFNHHMAGVFLLLIGLSEVRQALGMAGIGLDEVFTARRLDGGRRFSSHLERS